MPGDIKPFESLDAIIPYLEASSSWRRLGATGVAWNIKDFVNDVNKTLKGVRSCEDIPKRVNELFQLMPRGQKVGQEMWDVYEMLGAWTPEAEELVDKIQATLDSELLKSSFVEAMMLGCKCQRR